MAEIEREPSIGYKEVSNFISLLALDKKQKSFLSDKINKAEGLIRIFVHPFYSNSDFDNSLQRRVSRAVSKSVEANKVPVIILEEESRIANTKEQLTKRGIDSSGSLVYFIPTFNGSPVPKMSYRDKN
jgi:hypothetical protein